MNTLNLPHNGDHAFDHHGDPVEEAPAIAPETLERVHVFSVYALVQCTFLLLFAGMGRVGAGLALGLGVLALTGLALSHVLRHLIDDLYRQFHYREKFAVFLFHVGLVVALRLPAGIRDWRIILGVLLIALCLQGINHFWYGRIYFLSALLVFHSCLSGAPPPPAAATACWFALFLAAMRLDHLRHRVTLHGSGAGIELHSLAWRTLRAAGIPALCGYAAFLVAGRFLTLRRLVMDPGMVERDGNDVFLSYGEIFWNSVLLIGVIIGALVLLNWIEKKLRRFRKGTAAPEGLVPTTAGVYTPVATAAAVLGEEVPTGARERILAAFRRLARGLEPLGLGRHQPESAEEFLDRVRRSAPSATLDERDAAPFNKACYDDRAVTDEEARIFTETVDRILDEVRREKTAPPASQPSSIAGKE